MSIKALALELYRAQQKVGGLEQELAAAPLADRDRLRQRLREAQAEKDILRRMLDGEKETGRTAGQGNPFLRGR